MKNFENFRRLFKDVKLDGNKSLEYKILKTVPKRLMKIIYEKCYEKLEELDNDLVRFFRLNLRDLIANYREELVQNFTGELVIPASSYSKIFSAYIMLIYKDAEYGVIEGEGEYTENYWYPEYHVDDYYKDEDYYEEDIIF